MLKEQHEKLITVCICLKKYFNFKLFYFKSIYMASVLNKLDNETAEHLKEIIEIVKRKIIEEIEIYLSNLAGFERVFTANEFVHTDNFELNEEDLIKKCKISNSGLSIFLINMLFSFVRINQKSLWSISQSFSNKNNICLINFCKTPEL